LVFAWSGVNPISFQQKRLFDLRFTFSGLNSQIVFNSGCEIANSSLEIISIKYNDGNILSDLPKIELQPQDTLIKPGASVKFLVNATNVVDYAWKESRDNGVSWIELAESDKYHGTSSNELVINSIPVTFNNYRYSCTISSQKCFTTTADVILTVDNQASVVENYNSEYFNFNAEPNPINTSTILGFILPDNGYVKIQILDLSGKMLYELGESYYLKGCHAIDIDLSSFSKGIYVSRLMFKSNRNNNSTSLKLVKT
jgi:hypothetical protein